MYKGMIKSQVNGNIYEFLKYIKNKMSKFKISKLNFSRFKNIFLKLWKFGRNLINTI